VIKDEESETEILNVPSFDNRIATVSIKANGREGYKEDLRVRVTGYTGIFVDFPESLQDDIIKRMD
jgi:pyruvate-formate lyase